MDVAVTITHDHEEIRGLIDRIGELGDDAEYLVAQLKLRLAAHEATTETQIYRELLEQDPTVAELVGTRVERHRGLAVQLSGMEVTVGTEDFPRRLNAFADAVATEFDREESTVLPLLRQVFTDEWLDELGRRYELRWLAEMDTRTRHGHDAGEPTA